MKTMFRPALDRFPHPQQDRPASVNHVGLRACLLALGVLLGATANGRGQGMVDTLSAGVTWNVHAVASGNWNDGATWSTGAPPGDGDNVRIGTLHTVTVTHQDNANLDRILVRGTLQFANGNTRLNVDTLLVDDSPRGSLYIGHPGPRIGLNNRAEIVIVASPNVSMGMNEMGRGLISQGDVRMYSNVRDTKRFLQGDALAGATQLNLDATPTGWKVGDTIVVPQTKYSWSQFLQNETRVIQAINGSAITLDQPLDHDHIRAETGAEFQIAVANLTRPIVIRSADGVGQFSKERGHIMFGPGSDVFINGLQCKDLGRTDKTQITSASNPEARYSLHFHRNGYDLTHTIKRSVVWNTPGWGFVNHSSSVNFDDNVAYDFYGAGFSAEAGDELGSFTKNVAIGGIGDGQELRSTRDFLGDADSKSRYQAGDMGFRGQGYWLVSPQVAVTDNIAAGGNGAGIFWWTSGKREGDFITGMPLSRVPASAGTVREWIEPSQFTGETMGVSQDIPILSCEDNTSYGCYQGLKIRYVNGPVNIGYNDIVATTVAEEMSPTTRADSEYGPSVIDRFTAWNCLWGMHVSYGRNFTINDSLAVNNAASGQEKGFIGLNTAKGSNAGSHTSANTRARYFEVGIEVRSGQTHTGRVVQECDSDYLAPATGADSQINAQGWFVQGTPPPPPPLGGYRSILYDDFEVDMDNWIDGGTHCLHKLNQFAPQGGGSVKIRHGQSSSVMTTGNLDLANDSEIFVSFKYQPVATEASDGFSLEVSTDGGSSFSTAQSWTNLTNNSIASESVFITGLTLTSQVQLRFRCLSDEQNDNVYIDAVYVAAK